MSAIAEVPTRLSVIDDDDIIVNALERRLSREGYEVERVIPATPSLEDTVEQIIRVSDAALCDHDIRGGHSVDFSGAELVAALTERHFPAVLFTGVIARELYAIRRNMARIPSFLKREGGLGSDQVLSALASSVAEVKRGHRAPTRQGRRTPITIVETRQSGTEHLVSVLISGWPGGDLVDIPVDLLPHPWCDAPHDAVGRTFFASVNIGEVDAERLFFENFEPEPLVTEMFIGTRRQ